MKANHFLTVFLLGISILILPSTINAQTTVQVGFGTASTDNAPVKTTNAYHYSQSIYTAADIIANGATGAGVISKIRYNINSLNLTNSTNWTVYIGNTTKTSFSNSTDWVSSASMTTCFSGTVNPAAIGWMEITLSTPFSWNGVDNIVVAIDENQTGKATQSTFWNYTDYTNTRTLFFGGDSNPDPANPPILSSNSGNWTPNIQFVWTPSSTHCSPTSINFSDHHENFKTTGGIVNINDTDNTGASPGYKNKYATLFAQQIAGGSLGFSVVSKGTNVQFRIWVDWNSNNVFDASEEMFHGQNTGTDPTFSGNFAIPSIAPGNYRMRIRSVGGSGATLNPCGNITWGEARDYKIIVTAPTSPCSPTTSNASNNFSDHHENFKTTGGIVNINDTDNVGASPGYKDKYATLYAQQLAGSSLGFSVQSFGGNVKFKIWVDWNSNNVFDATEEMFNGSGASNPSFSGSFTVPSVTPGNYRMRIRSEGGSTAAVSPCGVIAWGEARDYKIVVVAPVTNCSGTPVSATISAPTSLCLSSSYSVSATGAPTSLGLSFQWQSSPNGSAPWSNVGSATSTASNLSVASFTGNLFYRLTTTCTNSSSTVNSNVVEVKTTPSFICDLGITAWYKPEANITFGVSPKVAKWGSNISTHDLTQGTASKQPELISGSSNYKLFNYNKRIKFNRATITRLENTSSTPDLLGTIGTVFLVLNKTTGVDLGTTFAYDVDGIKNSTPAYQFKAGFRFQTGNNGTGATYDHYGSGYLYYGNYFNSTVVADAAFLTSSSGTNKAQRIRINSISASATGNYENMAYNPEVNAGLSLGSAKDNAENSNDAIAEVILVRNSLTDAQKDMVDSYLCLKYGITRGNNSNANSIYDYNYVNSAGTVIFNKTNNTGFNNDIAGIGRDDGSTLNQKQSISVHSGEPVSIGLTSIASENTANTNTFTNNKSFLIWGNNGLMTKSDFNNPSTFSQLPAGIAARILRVWKTQATNFSQAVTVGFESSMLVNYLPLSNLVLLVNDNATNWTNASIYNVATNLNTGRVEFPGVTINNATPYFTLATINFTATPLPVEMVSNTLTKEACSVTMNWTVASEQNCDFYFIEKSVDGMEWSAIGEVEGSGNSNHTIQYSFKNRLSENNETYYYRLNQVDYNGEVTTYSPLSVSGSCVGNEVAIFPNPASNQVTVQIPENATMEIYDNISRLISIHNLQQGESIIQISHLVPGVYILRFTLKNGETITKSMVVK